jgi:hypothetical protein
LETEISPTEPYQDFLFAINSPVTKERYSTRLRAFFVHIGIEGTTMEERCRRFVEKVKKSESLRINVCISAYSCLITGGMERSTQTKRLQKLVSLCNLSASTICNISDSRAMSFHMRV